MRLLCVFGASGRVSAEGYGRLDSGLCRVSVGLLGLSKENYLAGFLRKFCVLLFWFLFGLLGLNGLLGGFLLRFLLCVLFGFCWSNRCVILRNGAGKV